MAEGNPNNNRQDSTTIDFSEGLTTQLAIPIFAGGNQNDHHQDSTAIDFSNSDTHGGDKCDNVGNIISAGTSNSSVAEGLYSLISSVMTSFNSRADATASSQDQLAFALDRLTRGGIPLFLIILPGSSLCCELDKLLEDAPSPFIMQHATRISGLRKRVNALNTVLKSIQRQIDNMDRMLSAGLMHGNIEWRKQQPTTYFVMEE
ncbi:hypothetical protein OROHE_010120 [Orobanche hederae]